MLVTNMGQVIRIRVHGAEGDSIRIAGRKTQGVRLFDVADDENERVVSAGLVRETDNEDDENLDVATNSEDTGSNANPGVVESYVTDKNNNDTSENEPNE